MRRLILICCLIVLAAAITACSKLDSKNEGTLEVKPYDLFAGDSKKVQPFLGLMSGGIKLDYKGDKNSIRANVEVWENGEKKEMTQSIGALNQITKSGDYVFNGEFIISVKKQQETSNVKKTHFTVSSAFIDRGGSTTSTDFQIEADTELVSSMPIVLSNKGQSFSENEEIAVWGMQASDQNGMQTVDLTPEMLKKVRWAIIIKISLADE